MTPASLIKSRESLGLSQSKLGKLLDVHPNTIACWERGDKPIGNPKMLALALWALKQQP
jgi:DNA-binding transcriptional regulator YiaG